jgi:predicted enzyme related to lactoylglutathione lyase
MARIVNFHLPARDVDRAAAFYREVFGFSFESYPDSPVPYRVAAPDGPGGVGISAAITARTEVVRAPVPTIEVDDIDAALVQVVMHGGQQAQVRELADIGRFAYAIDSEGNVIALLQPAR